MPPNNTRSFKSDESFLEKISIGAAGTRQVYDHLVKTRHKPIELERGSMSYKIWKAIKIKRLRVPDILCIDCGTRIESRAKTKLEITMSHSQSQQERGWDFGLRDSDEVALVVCKKIGEEPIDWKAQDFVQYLSVANLRKSFKSNQVYLEKPKGAQEGFEIRLTWPASISSCDAVIKQINESRIQISRQSDKRTISLSLKKKGVSLTPLVKVGDRIVENQIIAASVPVVSSLTCKKLASPETYLKQTKSTSVAERYAAVKALGHLNPDGITERLVEIVQNDKEHIYVRMEAAASLMRIGNKNGNQFIQECLTSDYLATRLEAVIALSEIRSSDSKKLLVNCLKDSEQHPEIRAGAAWALGELDASDSLPELVSCFASVEPSLKIEAARALAKIAREHNDDILSVLSKSDAEKRPGIAWALSKAGIATIEELIPTMVDTDAREWAAYVIGSQPSERFLSEIEKLKQRDPEVYFAVTVLWKIYSSWIYGLEEY